MKMVHKGGGMVKMSKNCPRGFWMFPKAASQQYRWLLTILSDIDQLRPKLKTNDWFCNITCFGEKHPWNSRQRLTFKNLPRKLLTTMSRRQKNVKQEWLWRLLAETRSRFCTKASGRSSRLHDDVVVNGQEGCFFFHAF